MHSVFGYLQFAGILIILAILPFLAVASEQDWSAGILLAVSAQMFIVGMVLTGFGVLGDTVVQLQQDVERMADKFAPQKESGDDEPDLYSVG